MILSTLRPSMLLLSPCFYVAVALGGCNSGATTESDQAPPPDLSQVDAATPVLAACPTKGAGAILAPAGCSVFTPAHAGADPSGVNAGQYQFALEPSGAAKGVLVIHLNGSLGSPAGQIADPQKNIYSALAVLSHPPDAVACFVGGGLM